MYSEPATRFVAHYTCIQLKPGIYSMGGFKAMQLERNNIDLDFSIPELAYQYRYLSITITVTVSVIQLSHFDFIAHTE